VGKNPTGKIGGALVVYHKDLSLVGNATRRRERTQKLMVTIRSWAAPPVHGLRSLVASVQQPKLVRTFASAAVVHPDRKRLLDCKRVVIKVGTAVVSNPNGTLALSRMGALVEEIASLTAKGKQVMLISSGAGCLCQYV